VTETATKLSQAPLQKHSPGGITIDNARIELPSAVWSISFRRAIPYSLHVEYDNYIGQQLTGWRGGRTF